MLNTTAYLSLLTKEKEILLNMQNHKLNLKHMKSINKNSPELKPVSINKNKTQYLKNRNQHQINIENDVLTEKIQRIIKGQRNSKYYSVNQKYSKSLNGYVKRITQQKINQDNLRLLQKLEHSKPTYSTKKYLEEFQHLKKVQKNMSSAEFYLTDSPRFRRRNLNTNRSFVTRRDSSVGSGSIIRDQNGLLAKETVKLSDGKLWMIKIYQSENKKEGLKIIGEIVMDSEGKDYLQNDSQDIKIITMPMTQANIFVARHCQNKVQNMIQHLKVDENDGSLMIVVPKLVSSKKINNNINSKDVSNIPSPTKLINPQEKRTNEIKLKKLQSLAGYEKKKIPSRQIFNIPQNKPALMDNLLVENKNQKQQQKDQVQGRKNQCVIEKQSSQSSLQQENNASEKQEQMQVDHKDQQQFAQIVQAVEQNKQIHKQNKEQQSQKINNNNSNKEQINQNKQQAQQQVHIEKEVQEQPDQNLIQEINNGHNENNENNEHNEHNEDNNDNENNQNNLQNEQQNLAGSENLS